jgi:hypothetical protein
MSSRNRTAGHNYERAIAECFQSLYEKEVLTSRNESRTKDANKIDLCNTDPLLIQCKLTKNLPPLEDLKTMKEYDEDGIPLIVWGRTKRAAKNMVKNGDYVIINIHDFLDLIERCREGEV